MTRGASSKRKATPRSPSPTLASLLPLPCCRARVRVAAGLSGRRVRPDRRASASDPVVSWYHAYRMLNFYAPGGDYRDEALLITSFLGSKSALILQFLRHY